MDPTPSPAAPVRVWELLALVVSLIALVGSLYLSVGMNLIACPLCLYERTFMMGLVAVLLIGSFRPRDTGSGFFGLLILPLAVGGLCVAGFHVFLELTDVLECPAGLFGVGSAPQQSLASFLLVLALVGIGLARSPSRTGWLLISLGAIVLGILLSVASIVSAPPLPKPPSEPYTAPMNGCRPMFHRVSQRGDRPQRVDYDGLTNLGSLRLQTLPNHST